MHQQWCAISIQQQHCIVSVFIGEKHSENVALALVRGNTSKFLDIILHLDKRFRFEVKGSRSEVSNAHWLDTNLCARTLLEFKIQVTLVPTYPTVSIKPYL